MTNNKALSLLNRIEDIALVAMFALMVGIIFVQVIMRYVVQNSLSWSEELGKFLFVWLSWVGISIGARRGEHIRITMLTDKFSFRGGHLCNIVSELIVIGICAVTFYYGIILVVTQNQVNFAGIKISMSWGYLSVVVGCGLMIIRCVIGILQSISSMRSGPPAEAQPEGGDA